MQASKMKILIIGAGGAGVSNIAQIYQEQGHDVIGVDKLTNAATENLESKGIPVTKDNDINVLDGVDLVFRSAAVKDDNILIVEANKRGIKLISRYELFEELSASRDVIAIAGSSGKTSTTGLVSHVLSGDQDCGYLIGIHGNGGHNGTTSEFVLEADEYAKTFLHISKMKIALITGLKYDHIDIYPTKKEYDDAFVEFAGRAEKLVLNGDDQYLTDKMSHLKSTTFGKSDGVDFQAVNIVNYEGGPSFQIKYEGTILTMVNLQVIGGHNVINALAAFVVNYINGMNMNRILARINTFAGMPRRLQVLRTNPYYVYDDYAHLPFEVETVLKGLRESFPKRRILCYFQGHTYTRINEFFDDYAVALANCDVLFLGDVYAARDSSGSVDLEKLISQVNIDNKVLSGGIESTKEYISTELRTGDILICLNAGDGTKVAHYFATK
jgi:UDP-N-acetylmuramate--alanine ligase